MNENLTFQRSTERGLLFNETVHVWTVSNQAYEAIGRIEKRGNGPYACYACTTCPHTGGQRVSGSASMQPTLPKAKAFFTNPNGPEEG